ncbi:MAG: protein TolR [Nitrospiraceae bacterium]|nr:protein TolR [Nitrospiraceae bacterium]
MTGERQGRGSLSEINVTPLVDVMLVLLVIFMVTAPLMKQGVDVNLPQAKGKSLPYEGPITINVKKDGSLYMKGARLNMEQMKARLSMLSKEDPDVYLEADRAVSYGRVAQVMGEIKDAGIQKLGIVTEPLKNK